MDGNYGSTLAQRLDRAETVIFLDIPRPVCLWRVLWRTATSYGRIRDDMPAGCPERFDWEFLKFIWNFQKMHRPQLIDALGHFDGTTIILKTSAEVTNFRCGPLTHF